MARVELTLLCTLGPEALQKRSGEWEALCRDALASVERDDDRLVLGFSREDDRIGELVRAEGSCCSFLELDVSAGPTLTIAAPEGGRATIDAFEALARSALRG